MITLTHLTKTIELVRKSDLVPSVELEVLLAETDADTPQELLNQLVQAQLLTRFQADRLGQGKYKGFHLGAYVILDRIGTGGMGQVYLAEHTTLKRLVAIKVLSVYEMEDPVSRERFVREAQAAASLNHPNIVQIFDLQEEGQVLYLVLEFVEGVTLQKWVTQVGPLSVGTAVNFARQIAMALQHAQDCGLVHRDIKPANILIDCLGAARLVDLGLALSDRDKDSKLTNNLSQAILGTADYLAPEQALNAHAVDIRADIYGLGATLYFLLAGQVMFPGCGTAQKLMAQQCQEPRPIRELNPEVPGALAKVLSRALAKKPADRFQTPLEFARALEPFVGECELPPTKLVFSPPPRPSLAGTCVQGNSTCSTQLGEDFLLTRTPMPRAGLDSQFQTIAADTKANVLGPRTPVMLKNSPRPTPPQSPAPGKSSHPPRYGLMAAIAVVSTILALILGVLLW